MIYLTGDQHAAWDKRKEFIQDLTEEDILITLGDWGFCWNPKIFSDYLKNNPKCIQLWLDGNHENFTYLESFPVVEIYGGKAHKLAENIYHLMRGEMYELEGKRFFVFGGALSIDRHWRKPYESWWPQEQPTEEEYQHALETLERYDWTFDFLLTHTADPELVHQVLGRQDSVFDKTESMIQGIKWQVPEHQGDFKCHFFGHLHSFWKSEYGNYKAYCLYDQIYNVDTEEFKFF